VFALVGEVSKYEKPMKEFLNSAMRRNQSGETIKAKRFFKIFSQVTDFISTNLGSTPFHLRGPLNASALDSVLCVVFESFEKLDKKQFRKNFTNLLNDELFNTYTSLATTDAKTVQDRVKLVRAHLLA
jgi:hypothetical protein